MFREIADSPLWEPGVEFSGGMFRITPFQEPVSGATSSGWSHLLGTLPISDGRRRMLLMRPADYTARECQRNRKG